MIFHPTGTDARRREELAKRCGVATTSNWQVIVIDAKGDATTQHAFTEMMRRAGRTTRLFSQEPFDGWCGCAREIAGRLTQLIDWADEGGGAYYRDLSMNLVRLACTAPDGPPRTSGELLRRLDKTTLLIAWAGREEVTEVERFREEHIDACRQRYRSFFDATAGQLDGDWTWEDAACAYVLLNALLYAEETTKLARFLIEDFKQYVAARKRGGQQVLMIVDQFSAIADGERTARMVEVVRSYGASVVLAPAPSTSTASTPTRFAANPKACASSSATGRARRSRSRLRRASAIRPSGSTSSRSRSRSRSRRPTTRGRCDCDARI